MTALTAPEKLDYNTFRGIGHVGNPGSVFGGQIAAQALSAASRTIVQDRPVHSLHGYFVKGGKPEVAIDYHVERLRDGRSYALRQVTARQGSNIIFVMTASFKRPEPGYERALFMSPVPSPEALEVAGMAGIRAAPRLDVQSPIHRAVSTCTVPPEFIPSGLSGRNQQLWWLRFNEEITDHVGHATALTYCSDLGMGRTAGMDRDQFADPTTRVASLDHAVWFHRPFRADEWLLYEQESSTSSDGRGFATGRFWSKDGFLVASTAQEVLIRSRTPLSSKLTVATDT